MSLREFFYFHKTDRRLITWLLVAAAAVSVALWYAGDEEELAESTAAAGQETSPFSGGNGGAGHYDAGGRKAELFPFDPNTADSTQLLRLGLAPWMVRNIYNYRAHGGTFRRAEDFARVYGLTVGQYEQLRPYIRISRAYQSAADVYAPAMEEAERQSVSEDYTYVPRDTVLFPRKLRDGQTIDINTADTTQLKKIPGIGSGYAVAVYRLRERLGGFYTTEQLVEIEGFPVSALKYVRMETGVYRKLNINKLTYKQLRQHPYINFYQARDIADYRRLKGNITSLNDLRLMPSFTKNDIERLSHYVEY